MQNSPNDFGSPVFSGTYSAPGETLFDLPTTTISPYDMVNFSNIGLSAGGSPEYIENSPLLEGEAGSPLDEWMPLFNDDLGGDITTFVQPSSLFGDSVEGACDMDRTFSATSTTPSCSSPTMSMGVIGGKITKKPSRKRASRELGPIKYDPTNPVEVKRAKNTAAARKSRQKKQQHVEELEQRLAESEERERLLREENKRLLDRLRLQEMSPAAWPLA